MSKHKKHRRDYNIEYDEINQANGFNNNNDVLNNITSALKNIDINQIASLLNNLGILNNSNNESNSDTEQKYNDGNIISDTELVELFKQANAVNDMITNSNVENKENYDESYENDQEKFNKEKKHKSKREKTTEMENEDTVIKLLNAIKPMVIEPKKDIIDKIIELYKKGEI